MDKHENEHGDGSRVHTEKDISQKKSFTHYDIVGNYKLKEKDDKTTAAYPGLINITGSVIGHLLDNGYALASTIWCSGNSSRHDGIEAHRAEYTSLDDFKQNAWNDYIKEDKENRADSSYSMRLDFSYTGAKLKGKDIAISVSLQDKFDLQKGGLTIILRSFNKDSVLMNENILHSISDNTVYGLYEIEHIMREDNAYMCRTYGLDTQPAEGDGSADSTVV